MIFLGTSKLLAPPGEVERLVKLYPQCRNRIHFVIVDQFLRIGRNDNVSRISPRLFIVRISRRNFRARRLNEPKGISIPRFARVGDK